MLLTAVSGWMGDRIFSSKINRSCYCRRPGIELTTLYAVIAPFSIQWWQSLYSLTALGWLNFRYIFELVVRLVTVCLHHQMQKDCSVQQFFKNHFTVLMEMYHQSHLQSDGGNQYPFSCWALFSGFKRDSIEVFLVPNYDHAQINGLTSPPPCTLDACQCKPLVLLEALFQFYCFL